jgi:hypothetical protein
VAVGSEPNRADTLAGNDGADPGQYAILCGMPRQRISTTVDSTLLATARRLLGLRDSDLLDQALEALVKRELARRELAALDAHPYERDPDLAWEAPPGPDLPYDGDIPADVRRLAARRRRR